MTCTFTPGAIPGSSFGAMSVIVREPGSAFGGPSGSGARGVSIRTGPHLSKASQDLSHDAVVPPVVTILGRVVIASSRRNAE